MKKTILTLIIGILIGAVITAGVFLIINGVSKNNNPSMDRGGFNKGNFDANNMSDDFDLNSIRGDKGNRGETTDSATDSNTTETSTT